MLVPPFLTSRGNRHQALHDLEELVSQPQGLQALFLLCVSLKVTPKAAFSPGLSCLRWTHSTALHTPRLQLQLTSNHSYLLKLNPILAGALKLV